MASRSLSLQHSNWENQGPIYTRTGPFWALVLPWPFLFPSEAFLGSDDYKENSHHDFSGLSRVGDLLDQPSFSILVIGHLLLHSLILLQPPYYTGRLWRVLGMVVVVPELSVIVNPIIPPTHTKTSGIPITPLEYQSDFIRVQTIHHYGGIYLDWDVFGLHSIKALLQSGFQFIAGRQKHGQLNSGVFMFVPRGKVISEWKEKMHEVYDGEWTTHSNKLLTDIVDGLAVGDGEVLVVERKGFAPVSWEEEDSDWLFGVYEGEEDVQNVEGIIRRGGNLPEWKGEDTGWKRTYLLHAFSPGRWNYSVEGFEGITLRYVLERWSEFSRAVYEVGRVMYERGLLGGRIWIGCDFGFCLHWDSGVNLNPNPPMMAYL
ncbi:hypothetical protein QBC38DRAFT_516012 [Podospora fimiseda]|uniref:Uncharacterized protein n=1 Tax=Podospora fimiseda TaxID=252190 RepID=A0AAN7BIJ7_9PEZI|nr:hypothetical protein QBC38DRAFT_516012 [Podospora fimiseda]